MFLYFVMTLTQSLFISNLCITWTSAILSDFLCWRRFPVLELLPYSAEKNLHIPAVVRIGKSLKYTVYLFSRRCMHASYSQILKKHKKWYLKIKPVEKIVSAQILCCYATSSQLFINLERKYHFIHRKIAYSAWNPMFS